MNTFFNISEITCIFTMIRPQVFVTSMRQSAAIITCITGIRKYQCQEKYFPEHFFN